MKSVLVDDKGRYILLNAVVQGTEYILGNVYAPNTVYIQQQSSFYEELDQILDKIILDPEQRVIIIGGDFNLISDLDLDCFGGSPSEKESAKFL